MNDEQAAMFAAEILDRIGDQPVSQHRERIRYPVPPPGVAVLACRCGQMLDSAQLRRRPRPGQDGAGALIERIVCGDCARPGQPIGQPRRPVETPTVVWQRGEELT